MTAPALNLSLSEPGLDAAVREGLQRVEERLRAAVRQADGTWLSVPVASVALDAVVRVRPGERVPMDGAITEGNSSINQASHKLNYPDRSRCAGVHLTT